MTVVFVRQQVLQLHPPSFACYWKLGWCEGFRSKLCNCSNQFKSWLHSNFEYVAVGFKIRIGSNVQYSIIGVDQDGTIALGI
jgi:hypothetical protein